MLKHGDHGSFFYAKTTWKNEEISATIVDGFKAWKFSFVPANLKPLTEETNKNDILDWARMAFTNSSNAFDFGIEESMSKMTWYRIQDEAAKTTCILGSFNLDRTCFVEAHEELLHGCQAEIDDIKVKFLINP